MTFVENFDRIMSKLEADVELAQLNKGEAGAFEGTAQGGNA